MESLKKDWTLVLALVVFFVLGAIAGANVTREALGKRRCIELPAPQQSTHRSLPRLPGVRQP